MKKCLSRLSIFSLTLLFGIVFVMGCSLITDYSFNTSIVNKDSEVEQSQIDKKLKVLFKGFTFENNETKLNFEIVNSTGQNVTYQSFEEKGNLFHFVNFNSKELPEFRCGTGLEEFTLSPNDMLSIKKIGVDIFHDKYTQKGIFQISFYLKETGKEYRRYWSEEFRIPSPIVKQLKKEDRLINFR